MSEYSVIPVVRDGQLQDIALLVGGKKRHMWGRRGVQGELALQQNLGPEELPVLLGSGLGVLAAELAGQGPVAVFDDQPPILDVTGTRQRLADHPNVLWLDGGVDEAMKRISRWREQHGGRRLRPLPIPLYLRQFPGVYGRLDAELRRAAASSVWERLRSKRFASNTPRVLLLSSGYFLVREIRTAMQRLGWPHITLDPEACGEASGGYVEELLAAVAEFRPDFLLTVNHFGADEGGGLFDLLERLRLPMASWFVDAPFLTLSLFSDVRTPWCQLFTFDRDNVAPLRDAAFPHVDWLPLATDPAVFRPGAGAAVSGKRGGEGLGRTAGLDHPEEERFTLAQQEEESKHAESVGEAQTMLPASKKSASTSSASNFAASKTPASKTTASGTGASGGVSAKVAPAAPVARNVAFVGHSGARLVAGRLKIAHFPAILLREYKSLAQGFVDAPEVFASSYVRRVRPELMPVIESLPAPGAGWFWSLITRQATRAYRTCCMSALMEFAPVIAGDRWWRGMLRGHEGQWQLHGTVDYYTQLPAFYASTAVNINMTDRQMPGAANQRVFDCPAAGGFLLTDRREQLEELFDPERELAFHEGPEDIAEKVRWYLKHPSQRETLTARARRRILDEHTYEHRLRQLAGIMRRTFGG